MPKTRLGIWASWLFVVGFILLVLVIIALNTELLGTAFERETAGGLALGILAAMCAVGSLITGAVSWLRLKDHSVLVIAATIYGVLATVLFVMGAMPQT